ncbi:MAG: hypothetical protein Q8942_00650 [Bacillota bacterium]|nr:hypothetical protein [Bacillota bacterium]
MIEFIINNFFLIAKLIISIGVVLCVLAVSVIRGNNKKRNINLINNNLTNNNLTKENTELRVDYIKNDKEKISRNNRILMGFGVTTIVVGIILFVVGIFAIIFVIYILFILKNLFDELGG